VWFVRGVGVGAQATSSRKKRSCDLLICYRRDGDGYGIHPMKKSFNGTRSGGSGHQDYSSRPPRDIS